MVDVDVCRRSAWLAWPALLAISGCQAIVDTSVVQCVTDGDCASVMTGLVCGADGVCQGPAAGLPQAGTDASGAPAPLTPDMARPVLQCAAPVQTPEAGRTVTVAFTVFNYSVNTIPPDVFARACERFDGTCASPVVDNVPIDALGFARFVVPHGFDGYFEIEGPNVVSSLVASNRTFYEDIEFEGPAMVSPAVRDGIAATGAVPIDSSTGIVILEVKGCDFNPVEGVTVSQLGTSAPASAFYFVDGLPDQQRTSTVLSPRLSLGGGDRSVVGFVGVPAGLFEAEGRDGEAGPPVMGALVQVRADWITYVVMQAGQ